LHDFSVIFDKLAKEAQAFNAATKIHINKYSESGLRTMAVAYRILSEEEYRIWHGEFSIANNAVGADHDAMVEAAAEKIERDLILIGATAVEDRLQKGVSSTTLPNQIHEMTIKLFIMINTTQSPCG